MSKREIKVTNDQATKRTSEREPGALATKRASAEARERGREEIALYYNSIRLTGLIVYKLVFEHRKKSVKGR